RGSRCSLPYPRRSPPRPGERPPPERDSAHELPGARPGEEFAASGGAITESIAAARTTPPCRARATLSPQRVPPAQAGEAVEVRIGGDQGAAVLEGDGRMLRVGDQLARGAGALAQAPEDLEMGGPG